MICPPHDPPPIVVQWHERHRHPASLSLHVLGIPPTIAGFLLFPIYAALVSLPVFLLALALFVGGYLIQFLGHAFDGTEPGEIAYLRQRWARSWAQRRARTERSGGIA